jgi:hypothetical protein
MFGVLRFGCHSPYSALQMYIMPRASVKIAGWTRFAGPPRREIGVRLRDRLLEPLREARKTGGIMSP